VTEATKKPGLRASLDVPLRDGRTVRAHDAGEPAGARGLTVLWHHGSPQTGELYEPLMTMAAVRGIRLISYARPSYGGSTPRRGRSVASAAADAAEVADALGVSRFAVIGASGGGPHALACVALLPDRVSAAVTLSSPAPYTTAFDWYAGMVAPGGLRAAARGREDRERFAGSDDFDPNSFTARDWASLEGAWAPLGQDAGRAGDEGSEGLVDDDLAFVAPWGFHLAEIVAPVLLIHGGEDRVIPRSHADWLLQHVPSAELWLRPRDGHISVLDAIPVALDWLRSRDELRGSAFASRATDGPVS